MILVNHKTNWKITYIRKLLEYILLWLHNREHYGVLRFNLVRFIYRIMPGYPETKNKRWDFILSHLPPLQFVYWVGLHVLDIGCTDTLLLHEIDRRGYHAYGMDIRDFNAKLPKQIGFFKYDILNEPIDALKGKLNYIIATAVIELVGIGKYGDEKIVNADRKAVENIHALLAPDGFFILSLPLWNWRYIHGRGYSIGDIYKLIGGLFHVVEMSQQGGSTCMILAKLLKSDVGGICFATTH